MTLTTPLNVGALIVDVPAGGPYDFDLELWFSADDELDMATDHLVTTLSDRSSSMAMQFNFSQGISLQTYEASRFCEYNAMYLFARVVEASANKETDPLDNLWQQPARLSCPGGEFMGSGLGREYTIGVICCSCDKMVI